MVMDKQPASRVRVTRSRRKTCKIKIGIVVEWREGDQEQQDKAISVVGSILKMLTPEGKERQALVDSLEEAFKTGMVQ